MNYLASAEAIPDTEQDPTDDDGDMSAEDTNAVIDTDSLPYTLVDPDEAWKLADMVMVMADTVQTRAYGALPTQSKRAVEVKSDRGFRSHREAVTWVQWVIRNLHPYPVIGDEVDPDSDEATTMFTTWSEEVANEAVSLLVAAAARVDKYLASRPRQQKPGSNTTARSNRGTSEPATNQGPSPRVVQSMLDTVTRKWDDAATVSKMLDLFAERGWENLQIGVASTDTTVPVLSFPAADGSMEATASEVLSRRLQEVGGTPTSNDPAPQQNPQNTGNGAAQQQSGPNVQNNTQPPTAAAPDVVGEIVALFNQAQNEPQNAETHLRAAWSMATQHQLAAFRIGVLGDPTHLPLSFVPAGTNPAAAVQPISTVINVLKRALAGNRQQQAATEAPAPAGTPDAAATTAEPNTAEPAVDGDKAQMAQSIALLVEGCTDVENLNALRDEATQMGLLGETISVGGGSGVLRDWIATVEGRISGNGQ